MKLKPTANSITLTSNSTCEGATCVYVVAPSTALITRYSNTGSQLGSIVVGTTPAVIVKDTGDLLSSNVAVSASPVALL
jgi:hypothetical protein